MRFDDLWDALNTNVTVIKCGGIVGVEERSELRSIFLDLRGYCRIWLKPDGTYQLDVSGSK